MKYASITTLRRNRKTRLSYAYDAIERETLCGNTERVAKADTAMDRLHVMPVAEMMEWAAKEQEWRSLNA